MSENVTSDTRSRTMGTCNKRLARYLSMVVDLLWLRVRPQRAAW
jgi:hypothetical protein